MHIVKIVAFNILVVIALLFALDRILAAFGYPEDVPFKTAHRPNVTKTLKSIEFEYEFSTNDLGLRYPAVASEKPARSVRILMLGDSFAEGVGVAARDSFGMLLQNHYGESREDEVLFINGGLGGEGPERFWRVFHQVGLALDPDGVLIFIYANDLMDSPESVTREELYRTTPGREGFDAFVHGLLPRVHNVFTEAGRMVAREFKQSGGFVATVQGLAREQGIPRDTVDAWESRLPASLVEASDNGEFNKSLLSMGLFNPGYWDEAINISSPRAERKYSAMRLILEEIASVAREQGMAVGLVYIPAPFQYDLSRHASWNPWVIGGVQLRPEWASEDAEIQRRLADWARDSDIPFLDMTPALRAAVTAGGDLNFRLDGHWNAEGHRVAGEAVKAWLDKTEAFSTVLDKDGGS